MVLLHGFSSTWRAWTPVLPALEAHHAVFAPTALGHHGGPAFADGEPRSLAAMVNFVERQMDAEGIDRAHFVGNSMGGWLSLELALRGRALSVVGLCPAGGFERDSREAHAVVRFLRRNEVLLRVVRPWLKTIARRAPLRAIAYRDAVAHPSRMDASLALAGLEGASNCAIIGGEIGGLVDELANATGWAAIECPIRIAVSTDDRILRRPSYYTRMRQLLPNADWISLDGLGHMPMTDDPARISEVILEVSAAGR